MGNMLNFIFEYNDYIKNIENTDKHNYIYNQILQKSKFGRLPIAEGLIFTHPIDKSTNILKRRFPELNIDIEVDNEIYIENQPGQDLNKYLPIITNLGYFVSKYTINGNDIWIQRECS